MKKLKIEANDTIFDTMFFEIWERGRFLVIDKELFGKQLARELIKERNEIISIDDLYRTVEDAFTEIKHEIENYAEEYIINNFDGIYVT